MLSASSPQLGPPFALADFNAIVNNARQYRRLLLSDNRRAHRTSRFLMRPESSAYGTFAHEDDEFSPSGCDMVPPSPFQAYTTRPAPKFNPSWWWNSIRGAEWFHLYLWMLKDFLWCPPTSVHRSLLLTHSHFLSPLPGLKTLMHLELLRGLQRQFGPFFCWCDLFAMEMVWKRGITLRNSFGCLPTRGGCTGSSLTGVTRTSPRYNHSIRRRRAT
jgi:hypothetical protein